MRGWVIGFAGIGLIWVLAFSGGDSASRAGDAERPAGGTGIAPQPVVVELFTSEGCSSCPPADRLLIELQQSQPVAGARIIALSEHVDYWNRLGWSDPFSSRDFSMRQQSYAEVLGNEGPYTPQMVVDGQKEFVGNNRARAFEAIGSSARTPKARVRISRTEGVNEKNPLEVSLHVLVDGLDRTPSREQADVWLAITEDDLVSSVVRGENAGRRLKHVAVVRQMRVIGKVEPDQASTFSSDPTVRLQREWNRGKLNAVIFIQGQRTRRILGAGAVSL